MKRPMHPEERKRKARIRKLYRDNTEIFGRRGRWTVRLVIDHQSFQIGEMGSYSLREAKHFATNLAIALHRFKYGD